MPDRWGQFAPYVSVAERAKLAAREVEKLKKSGKAVEPVVVAGRKIAASFWGAAWCKNLEGYSDFASRLPRGRSYVRSGAVVHLGVAKGSVEAMVRGSELYEVRIGVTPVAPTRWAAVRAACAGNIASVVELLKGKLSAEVMKIITAPETGLFPAPNEISMKCSCPDWATMCKHVAASLYGIGARLDHEPGLLFTLRGVDAGELIREASVVGVARKAQAPAKVLSDDLGDLFGIELGDEAEPEPEPELAKKKPAKKVAKKVAKKKPANKKP